MEKDDEVKGEGNSYNTDFRMYDPRVGRWLSIDPITHPWESPYVGFNNDPINIMDPSGAEGENGTEGCAPERNGTEEGEEAYGTYSSKWIWNNSQWNRLYEVTAELSNASQEWKDFIGAITPEQYEAYIESIYEKKLAGYTTGIGAGMYGHNSDGTVAVPSEITSRLRSEAIKEAMPSLKEAWAELQADQNGGFSMVWRARAVSSHDEGVQIASKVGVQVATDWILAIVAVRGFREYTRPARSSFSINRARWAQKDWGLKFDDEGALKGKTVDDVITGIRNGSIDPKSIRIDVVERDGVIYILNTRSSTALTRAGISRNDWTVVNRTGQTGGKFNYEEALTRQLTKKGNDPTGTYRIHQRGNKDVIIKHRPFH